MRPPNRRGTAAALLGLAVSAAVCSATSSAAQNLFPRGDADCTQLVTAADVVASLRALGGASDCGNSDCDRDGTVTRDDVGCALGCAFGECPVPPNAPAVSGVMPESGEAIAPFATIRITGVNFDTEDTLTQVTIGVVPTEIVDVVAAEGTAGGGPASESILVVVPPLPPGPADVVVTAGEVGGFRTSIDVGPQVPLGDPDTLDGTLDLLDTMLERFATLDLPSEYGEDADAVREAIRVFREKLVEQRVELTATATAELRAQLDAGFDSSGVPDQLRNILADIDQLLDQSAAGADHGGPAQELPPSVSRIARAARTTVAVARGVLGIGAKAVGAIAAVAVGASLLAGALTGAAIVSQTPILLSHNYRPPTVIVGHTSYAQPNGGLDIEGKRLAGTSLVLRTAVGEFVLGPALSDTPSFVLPDAFGFCGRFDFFMRGAAPLRVSTDVRSGRVQPVFARFTDPRGSKPGEPLRMLASGVRGCENQGPAQAEFSYLDDPAQPVVATEPLSGFVPAVVTSKVPNEQPGRYRVDLSVAGLRNVEGQDLTIESAVTGVAVSCVHTTLELRPGSPNETMCTATLLPAGVEAPRGSRLEWSSSALNQVSFTTPAPGQEQSIVAMARARGSARITAELRIGDRRLVLSEQVEIVVRDASAPTVSISSTSASTVPPGGTIPIQVTAMDNAVVLRVVLHASGEAVQSGAEQEDTCPGQFENCTANFTVGLQEMGFTDRTVFIVASAFDGAGNEGRSATLAFTVEADTTCPPLGFVSPSNGGSVNAGSTNTVRATATDNVGVERFVYSASGDALTAQVDSMLTLPMATAEADLGFNFTVKSATDLLSVSNRAITITAEAFDKAGNTCGPQTITVSVIGVLDQCGGGVRVDPPRGYIGDAATITVTIAPGVADLITRVSSINPAGRFELADQGKGVWSVTLFYEGMGTFTLNFTAFDAGGNALCSGSIQATSLGTRP